MRAVADAAYSAPRLRRRELADERPLGSYSLDFSAWIPSGVDPLCVAGQASFAQYWSRDPLSPSTTGLTNALSLVIGS